MSGKVAVLFFCVSVSAGLAAQVAIFDTTSLQFSSGDFLTPNVSPLPDGFSISGLTSFEAITDSSRYEVVSLQASESFTVTGDGGYAVSIFSGAYLWSNLPTTTARLIECVAYSTIDPGGMEAVGVALPRALVPYSPDGSTSIY